jgi:hypothetical protein
VCFSLPFPRVGGRIEVGLIPRILDAGELGSLGGRWNYRRFFGTRTAPVMEGFARQNQHIFLYNSPQTFCS